MSIEIIFRNETITVEDTFSIDFSGGMYPQGLQGERGPAGPEGPRGPKGDPGHTPEKGVDYWTSSDIESMESDILESQTITDIQEDITQLSGDLTKKYEKPSSGIPASDLADGVIPEVPVQDVQVNGTSILGQDGVAEIPVAGLNTFGVMKINSSVGFRVDSTGYLRYTGANASLIKTGTDYDHPLMPERQHESTFYGLAKASGDSTQSASSNAVGTYTDAAQSAIRKMLGTPGNSDIAYIETGVVAQRAYKAGEYFVDLDGILSKATDAIASGGSLVLDTNYEHVGGQGGLANDLFKPAELVADVTVGADIPSSTLSIPLSKPCRHLVIDIKNNNDALPYWSYIRLNYRNSSPALQVNPATSAKRAFCIIDLTNKYGVTLLKNTVDGYANAGQTCFEVSTDILSFNIAEEIGFCFSQNMVEGFRIQVYGR